MKSLFVLLGIALFGVASVASLRADMPWGHIDRRPKGVPPANAVSIIIEADATAKEPRLLIPKALAGCARPSKPVTLLPAAQHGKSPALLLPIGGALALSYAGAGLCLICGRSVSRRLILLLALAGGGGAAVWATSPAPHPVAQHLEGLPLDGVAVEFVDHGESIRLVVPRTVAADMAVRLHADVHH